ncbi:hypothetical protein [Phenylobacterium sp.]
MTPNRPFDEELDEILSRAKARGLGPSDLIAELEMAIAGLEAELIEEDPE